MRVRFAVLVIASVLALHCGTGGSGATTAPARDATGDGGATTTNDGGADAGTVPEIDVFLIAGQSNGVGTAVRGDSPTVVNGAFQYYAGAITPANDPVGNANVVSAWPAFANAYIAKTGHRLGLVPAAVAGSALLAANDDGHGNWTAAAFDDAVAQATAGLAAFRARGLLPHWQGVLWVQGETDAAAINAGTSTEPDVRKGLRDLIRRFAARLPASGGFYVFQTGTNAGTSDLGFAALRRAEDAVATPLENVFVVARDAITFPAKGFLASDGLHYTQAGLNELGETGGTNVGSIVRGGPNHADVRPDTITALACAGHTVSFATFANGSGACAAATWAISLGDQSALEVSVRAATPDASSSCAPVPSNPVHTYSADGSYSLELDRGSIADAQAGDATIVARSAITLGRIGNGEPLDVFIVAGQSNALGTSLAPWRAPRTEPGFAFQFISGNDDPNDVGNLGPGCVLGGDEIVGISSQGSAWPQFAVTYAQHSGHRVAFVTTASGGAALLSDASGNSWSPRSPLLDRALRRVSAALPALVTAGFTPTVRGVLWSQGEADALASRDSGAAYEAALRDLIARFRTGLGGEVPFYVFQSGDQVATGTTSQADLDAGYVNIRAAEDAVEDPAHAVHVVTRVARTFRARGMMNDIVHYDQAGYNELGRTGAESVVALAGIDGATPRESDLAIADGMLRGILNEASSCDPLVYSLRAGNGTTTDLFVPGGSCAPRAFAIPFDATVPGPVELFLGSADDVAAGLGHRASTLPAAP